MKNRYIYILFLSFLISEECLDKWLDNHSFILNKQFNLVASTKHQLISFYYDVDRYRIETNEFILISNQINTSKYLPEKNKLFIDKKDEQFNKYINSFINFSKLKRKFKKISNNVYEMKNLLHKTSAIIFFDEECSKLDSIYVKSKNFDFHINKIKIDSIFSIKSDSLFQLNLNSLEGVEIHDFR